jgi:hypothetical protein
MRFHSAFSWAYSRARAAAATARAVPPPLAQPEPAYVQDPMTTVVSSLSSVSRSASSWRRSMRVPARFASAILVWARCRARRSWPRVTE